MSESRTLKGTILGVGAPNETKNGDHTMCAILLTKPLGFIRVYPIPAEHKFRVWHYAEVTVERGNDARIESYKLLDFEVSDNKVTLPDNKRSILDSCILSSGTEDPIVYQNERRKSIALIKINRPYSTRLEVKVPTSRDESWRRTQQKAHNKAYLGWTSQQGGGHESHLVGREVYEGLANFIDTPHRIFENLQLNNPDWEHWLMLGNMKNRLNVWVGVHVFRLKKPTGGSTPLFSDLEIGSGDAWPYSTQEIGNVTVADGQLEMFTTSDMT